MKAPDKKAVWTAKATIAGHTAMQHGSLGGTSPTKQAPPQNNANNKKMIKDNNETDNTNFLNNSCYCQAMTIYRDKSNQNIAIIVLHLQVILPGTQLMGIPCLSDSNFVHCVSTTYMAVHATHAEGSTSSLGIIFISSSDCWFNK